MEHFREIKDHYHFYDFFENFYIYFKIMQVKEVISV